MLAFIADRLKVHLREEGVRHDLIACCFCWQAKDDLVRLLARVEALADRFLAMGRWTKPADRVSPRRNIVAIEERNDARRYDGRDVTRAFEGARREHA